MRAASDAQKGLSTALTGALTLALRGLGEQQASRIRAIVEEAVAQERSRCEQALLKLAATAKEKEQRLTRALAAAADDKERTLRERLSAAAKEREGEIARVSEAAECTLRETMEQAAAVAEKAQASAIERVRRYEQARLASAVETESAKLHAEWAARERWLRQEAAQQATQIREETIAAAYCMLSEMNQQAESTTWRLLAEAKSAARGHGVAPPGEGSDGQHPSWDESHEIEETAGSRRKGAGHTTEGLATGATARARAPSEPNEHGALLPPRVHVSLQVGGVRRGPAHTSSYRL